MRRALAQDVGRRQRVGDVPGEQQLLDPGRHRRVRRRRLLLVRQLPRVGSGRSGLGAASDHRFVVGDVRGLVLGHRALAAPWPAALQRLERLYAEVGDLAVDVGRLLARPVHQPGEDRLGPLGQRVQRRRGDHEQAEEQQQHQQWDGDVRRDRRDQRGGHQEAEVAAGLAQLVVHRWVGQSAGDVHQADDGEHDSAQADADPPAGLGVLRVPQDPHAQPEQDQRQHQPDLAEGARDDGVHDPTDRSLQVPPLDGGDHGGQPDQGQADAVAAVRRVQLARAAADPPGQRPDQVGDAEPEPAQRPHRPGRSDPSRGRLAGRRLAGGRPAGRRLARRRLRGAAGARGRTGGHGGEATRPSRLHHWSHGSQRPRVAPARRSPVARSDRFARLKSARTRHWRELGATASGGSRPGRAGRPRPR